MILNTFPCVFLVATFGQCTDLCSSPKYIKKNNVKIDTSGCLTNIMTREHCINHCNENSCMAVVFDDLGQPPICCTYNNSSDIYYINGEFTLYYKMGIKLCAANQKPPDCVTCINKYDPTTGCTTCMGNYDPASDCTSCIGNFDLDSECINCTLNWAGDQCNSCDFGLTGSDCMSCATNVTWIGEYTLRYDYINGQYMLYYPSEKDMDFTLDFSGPSCQTFTGTRYY